VDVAEITVRFPYKHACGLLNPAGQEFDPAHAAGTCTAESWRYNAGAFQYHLPAVEERVEVKVPRRGTGCKSLARCCMIKEIVRHKAPVNPLNRNVIVTCLPW